MTFFLGFLIGFIAAVIIVNAARGSDAAIIEEFKKSNRFKLLLKEHLEQNIGATKNVAISETTVANAAKRERTNVSDLDFSQVEFQPEARYTQQEIARFSDNKIPKEWLRPKKVDNDSVFNGKKVVITGDFSMSRQEIAKELWELGADIDTTIGKNTEIVVMGENPGWRKLEQIEEHGITVLTEDELLIHLNKQLAV